MYNYDYKCHEKEEILSPCIEATYIYIYIYMLVKIFLSESHLIKIIKNYWKGCQKR